MSCCLLRAATLLHLPKPSSFISSICVRNLYRTRTFCTTIQARKLTPVTPPDISKHEGVDLHEFIGSPEWQLEDLLPPSRREAIPGEDSITPQTLNHLLQLSGLPQPKTPEEEDKLLSALHDQLHFVRHVQSVPTENVEPLIRVGNENVSEQGDNLLTFEECVEEGRAEEIPGLEWKEWDVTSLNGGSREGREQGWFVVNEMLATEDEE